MENALAKNFSFFWLPINYASNFPIILSLSFAANPRAIVVKCGGSVYDVDVDFCSLKIFLLKKLSPEPVIHTSYKADCRNVGPTLFRETL